MNQLKAFFILSVLALAALPWACSNNNNNPTTPNNPPAATNTPMPTFTLTPAGTPTNTATQSPTSTPSSTATQSPTTTPTSTPTNSPTTTPSNTPTVTPTCFMGAGPNISGTYGTNGTLVLLVPYQAPSTGNIYKMTGELVSGNGPSYYYQFGVYDDDGSGNPNNLLGSTPIITFPPLTAFSIQTQTFGSPIPITTGSTYWLAFFGNGSLYDDYNSTAGQSRLLTVTGGPTPMPSSAAPASLTGLATGQPVYYLNASTCP